MRIISASDAGELATPALVVSIDRVRRNVLTTVDSLDGACDRWRPHLKTTKIPLVWKTLLEAGLRSFKCATLREARIMLDLVRRLSVSDVDLLIAYPLVGPSLAAAAQLAQDHAGVRLSMLVEDVATARSGPDELGMFADINVGMNRTGIPMDMEDRLAAVVDACGERFRGLHAYEGHIRDADPAVRRQRTHHVCGRVVDACNRLSAAGLAVPEVITSGTPTFLDAATFDGWGDVPSAVHRVSPGTIVFHDAASEELLPGAGYEYAAMVLARVVSQPAPRMITVDAGSKSIAAEAGDPCARVDGQPGCVVQRPSEEHLPIVINHGELPARGETLLLVPRHVCPTVNLAEEAVVVENGRVVDVVAVEARSH